MKKISIIGAGESGIGAALLAKNKGLDVFVSDYGSIKEVYKEELKKAKISFEENAHSLEQILSADFVIKSPGISNNIAVIQKIQENEIPIWSEIEFASQYCNKPIIAITGSNGKTTTTLLIAHILRNDNNIVAVGGNIGKSFARLLLEPEPDYYVLEVSSFQLDDIEKFKPKVSIILNITPDHLDRYNSDIDQYAKSKMRIAENQTEEDYFIFNTDDELIQQELKKSKILAKKLSYSLKDESADAFATDKEIVVKYPSLLRGNIKDFSLKGKHNVSNALAATLNSNILKINKQVILNSLTDFDAVEHRLEPVLTIHGINFINDSKATNVNATYYALQSIEKPIIWIAGGVDKGNNYDELRLLVQQKVHAIICLGLDNSKIRKTFNNIVSDIVEVNNMKDAVQKAYAFGSKGDSVLLSPACASFDLFKNFEDRGVQFKNQVKQL